MKFQSQPLLDAPHQRLLTRERLDALAAAGCQHPGCKHDDHSGTFWLNQRCHPGAPRFLNKRVDILTFRCVIPECALPVVSFKAKAEALVPGARWMPLKGLDLFEQPCCKQTSAVGASYTKDSGKINVICYYCEKTVATFEV